MSLYGSFWCQRRAGPVTYDANQNITSGLGQTYTHDAAGRLIGTARGSYSYDPAGRMYGDSASGILSSYAGVQLSGEHNSSGTMLVRHVPGPGLDQPIVSYSGASLATRTWLANDERQSVINLSDGSGNALTINRYDEYGMPASGNAGRFQYTGQAIIEPGLYNYRNRAYAPQFGRFLQTDPIGYGDGPNLYGYVGGDPINRIDPWGLQAATPIDDVFPKFRRVPLQNGKIGLLEARSVVGVGNREPRDRDQRNERDRFCSAYSAVRGAADAYAAVHQFAGDGVSVAQGRRIDLGALKWNERILSFSIEGFRAVSEISGGRSPAAAWAGAGARLAVDAAASSAGAAAGALVGIESGPGAIIIAGVGSVALPLLVDSLGIREDIGDLASGVSVGLTPEDCNG